MNRLFIFLILLIGLNSFGEKTGILRQEFLLDTEHRDAAEIIDSPDFTETDYGKYLRTGGQGERVWIRWTFDAAEKSPENPAVCFEYPLPHFQRGFKHAAVYRLESGTITAEARQSADFDALVIRVPGESVSEKTQLLFSFTPALKHFPFIAKLEATERIQAHRKTEIALTMLAAGFVLSVVALSLFLFAQFRLPVFFWYALAYALMAVRFVIRHDIFPAGPDSPDLPAQLLITAAPICAYLFVMHLFDLRKNSPRLHRFVILICALHALLLPLQLSTQDFRVRSLNYLLPLLGTFAVALMLIRIIARNRFQPRWFPCCWLVILLIGYSGMCLASFGTDLAFIKHLYLPALLVMCLETFLFAVYASSLIKTLKAQHSEARWEALHAQLNPHFIFNVMNSLGGVKNLKDLNLLTSKFAAFLRYILLSRKLKTVPLKTELEALQNYVATDNVRFPGEAQVSIAVPDELQNVHLPPLTLQPLVENALKFSRAQQLRPQIEIAAERTAAHLMLRVCNRGKMQGACSDGTRTGLQNLRDRLAALYGSYAEVLIEERDGRVCATVRIDNRARKTAV